MINTARGNVPDGIDETILIHKPLLPFLFLSNLKNSNLMNSVVYNFMWKIPKFVERKENIRTEVGVMSTFCQIFHRIKRDRSNI